jgi:hypothetical protein
MEISVSVLYSVRILWHMYFWSSLVHSLYRFLYLQEAEEIKWPNRHKTNSVATCPQARYTGLATVVTVEAKFCG